MSVAKETPTPIMQIDRDFTVTYLNQAGAGLVGLTPETAIGKMCIDVFGKGWGSFKIAHMSTGDKIGVEMFEFKNNETPKDFEYWKTSTFHFCVQDPDIETRLVAGLISARRTTRDAD